MSFRQILEKKGDYKWLEEVHSYIQWLFPTFVKSKFNPDCYALTDEEVKIFKSDMQIASNFLEGYKLMLDFYGIKLVDQQTGELSRASNYLDRYQKTFIASPQNHMRITRILTNLNLVGFRTYAIQLSDFLWQEMNQGPNPPLAPLQKQFTAAVKLWKQQGKQIEQSEIEGLEKANKISFENMNQPSIFFQQFQKATESIKMKSETGKPPVLKDDNDQEIDLDIQSSMLGGNTDDAQDNSLFKIFHNLQKNQKKAASNVGDPENNNDNISQISNKNQKQKSNNNLSSENLIKSEVKFQEDDLIMNKLQINQEKLVFEEQKDKNEEEQEELKKQQELNLKQFQKQQNYTPEEMELDFQVNNSVLIEGAVQPPSFGDTSTSFYNLLQNIENQKQLKDQKRPEITTPYQYEKFATNIQQKASQYLSPYQQMQVQQLKEQKQRQRIQEQHYFQEFIKDVQEQIQQELTEQQQIDLYYKEQQKKNPPVYTEEIDPDEPKNKKNEYWEEEDYYPITQLDLPNKQNIKQYQHYITPEIVETPISTEFPFFPLILTVIFFFLFIGQQIEEHLKAEDFSYFYVVIYIVYLVECVFSPIPKLIREVKSYKDTIQYLNNLKNLNPKIEFIVEAYHFETSGSNKNIKKKVVTFRDIQELEYKSQQDVTQEFSNMFIFSKIFKLEVTFFYYPGDRNSKQYLKEMKEDMIATAYERDRQVILREKVQVKTFQKQILGILSDQDKPIVFGVVWYIFFSVLGLSFFYRQYINNNTAVFKHKIVKKVNF